MDYYQVAKQASSEVGNHQGLLYLQEKAKHSRNILDVGCGEGTRLNTLLPKTTPGVGVDINRKAIKLAKSQYPRHKFISTNDETLPFKDNSFELVYSAFVLEHTKSPKKFLNEMLRVLSPRGELVILCPNYGAPNRRSPNSTESPVKKLIKGFTNDFLAGNDLAWTKVKPKRDYQQIDDDTTVEPYILSLKRYLKCKKLKIIKISSLWSLEEKTINPRKLLFFTLGQLNISPFKYWGPQIFIATSKQ